MKHKNSHLFVGYWDRQRRGRPVPDQSDIDPRQVKRMLSQIFILDATNVARPRYRLAGTAVCERFGHELRDANFFSQWEQRSATQLSVLLGRALRDCEPLCLLSIGVSPDAGMVEIETILVPVSFGNVQPTRFIGMMQILGDATHLSGCTFSYQRLVGADFVREEKPIDKSPPGARGGEHPGAPHLRLVVNRRASPGLPFEGEWMFEDVLSALRGDWMQVS